MTSSHAMSRVFVLSHRFRTQHTEYTHSAHTHTCLAQRHILLFVFLSLLMSSTSRVWLRSTIRAHTICYHSTGAPFSKHSACQYTRRFLLIEIGNWTMYWTWTYLSISLFLSAYATQQGDSSWKIADAAAHRKWILNKIMCINGIGCAQVATQYTTMYDACERTAKRQGVCEWVRLHFRLHSKFRSERARGSEFCVDIKLLVLER